MKFSLFGGHPIGTPQTKTCNAHCWHYRDFHERTCCNCGTKEREMNMPEFIDGHGPYCPPITVKKWVRQ